MLIAVYSDMFRMDVGCFLMLLKGETAFVLSQCWLSSAK